MNGKACDSCVHWQLEDAHKPWNTPCCVIEMGLDCYHNKEEHWKHWEGHEDFINEEEMTI